MATATSKQKQMRIRFKTKDNLTAVREYRGLTEPPAYIDRRTLNSTIPIFRRYEYRGEVQNRIPTLHEI